MQQLWHFLHLLGWKDRYLEIMQQYGATSFRLLSADKQLECVDYLKTEWNNRTKRPRSAVIHYLCIMPNYDYTTGEGKPNYEKIDQWVESKFKKPLNKLSLAELNKCVSAVKFWYGKEITKSK